VKKFKELQFALMNEGSLAVDLDNEIKEASIKLVDFAKKWGEDAAKGVTAKINLVITLKNENPADGVYSCKGRVSSTVPTRPARLSVAIAEENEDGQPSLFVRGSGSTADSPRQTVLSTKDGRAVDEKTGEVLSGK
jgi:hypothetical protein